MIRLLTTTKTSSSRRIHTHTTTRIRRFRCPDAVPQSKSSLSACDTYLSAYTTFQSNLSIPSSARLPTVNLSPLLHPHSLSARCLSTLESSSSNSRTGFYENREDSSSDEKSTVRQLEAELESKLSRAQSDEITTDDFVVVLQALANESQRDPSAARRAERWMARLQTDFYYLEPTMECYQAVIQTWGNCWREKPVVMVNRAERWFEEYLARCQQQPQQQYERMKPSIEIYNAFLDVCTRGRSGTKKKDQSTVQKHARKAEAILRRLHSERNFYGDDDASVVIPNTDTFNFVIRGITRCRTDESIANRVLSLLRLMESYQREDPLHAPVRPNTKSYTMAMDALVTVAKIKAIAHHRNHHHRKRNSNAHANDDDGNGPNLTGLHEIQEAQAILNYMQELYDNGVEGVVPSTVPHNILITGWAAVAGYGHTDAPFEAEKLLRKMIAYKDDGLLEAGPDLITYEKIILAWANSGHENAGKRALWWLQQAWNDAELESDPKLLPNTKTYNTVMKAIAAAEGAEAVESLLFELGDKYKHEQDMQRRPNSESFSIVIRAWLRKAEFDRDVNKRKAALRRAVDWLQSLREVENEREFNTAPELFRGVLKAARRSAKGSYEVLRLSRQVFEDLRSSRHQMDCVAYLYFLHVGRVALSGYDNREERYKFVMELFNDCKEEGHLSGPFLDALQSLGGDEWLTIKTDYLGDMTIPPSWTRNIRSKQHMPTKEDFY